MFSFQFFSEKSLDRIEQNMAEISYSNHDGPNPCTMYMSISSRHVAPLGHIILNLNQPVFAVIPAACLAEKQQIPNKKCQSWVSAESCLNPQFTALEAITPTFTLLMCLNMTASSNLKCLKFQISNLRI
jgi:hypothetical protein